MDPFEEFEFKPLTEGLGFQKKEATTPEIKSTLPRVGEFHQKTITGSPQPLTPVNDPLPNTTVEDILSTLKTKKFDFTLDSDKTEVKVQKTEFRPSVIEFSAALLDGMLIVALNLLGFISLLLTTHVDLIRNVLNPDSDQTIYLALVAMAGLMIFLYLVICRMFLGFTPGEWVFDQRLGDLSEFRKRSYSLKVIFRTLVVIFTGVVLIPIFSKLFNKDLAGSLSGIKIVRKV